MTSLQERPVIGLRPATIDDCDDLLTWRNDPVTRAMSRDHGAVERDVHRRWLESALADADRVILIGECDGGKVGMVRFDRNDEGWEVSINLDPALRGKGLGAALLAQAVEVFVRNNSGPALTATVRVDNTASRKIFAACGFRPAGISGGHDHFFRPGGDRG